MERVVITGMGAITPIGVGVEAFWDGVKSGKSGIAPITLLDASKHEVKFAGEATGFDIENYIERKEARRMDRFVHLAMAASQEALKNADLQVPVANAERVGVVIGCGVGGLTTWEREFRVLIEKGPNRVSPFLIPMMISNMASGHVAIWSGAKGPNTTMVSACASSAHAIGFAYDILKRGDADIMVAGGTEAPISDCALAGFGNMRALSKRNDDPSRASRPFDLTRDGFVMGEGAGILVLETLTSARKRGANIIAEMVGYGMNDDAYHITGMPEDGSGIGVAMKLALKHSGIAPTDVQYINAHGTSTPTNDKTETVAVKLAFGEHAHKLAMSSTKSQIGHLLGGGSAVEFIATCLGLREQVMPPTINYQTPDPECDLDYVTEGVARPAEIEYAISNSSGFGGHNVCLAARRWSEN